MRKLGIHTGADLKMRSRSFLVEQFGKAGNYYYNIARARDNRTVEANRIREDIEKLIIITTYSVEPKNYAIYSVRVRTKD